VSTDGVRKPASVSLFPEPPLVVDGFNDFSPECFLVLINRKIQQSMAGEGFW